MAIVVNVGWADEVIGVGGRRTPGVRSSGPTRVIGNGRVREIEYIRTVRMCSGWLGS